MTEKISNIFVSAIIFMAFLLVASCSKKTDSATIQNPRLRTELLAMAKKDQDIRQALIGKGIQNPDDSLMTVMFAVDGANIARVQEIVNKYGWPGIDLVGKDGSEAAFLIVQHANLDVQKKMLPLVETVFKKGDLSGQSYALLTDRVRAGEGKPQLYGTQFDIIDGKIVMKKIEDKENVDQRRKELGMIPLEEYIKISEELYGLKDHGILKKENK